MECIVNVAQNWGIGCGERLLVSISADLRRFRALTEGKVVILGRKTLATFPGGRPLKNRENFVLSTRPGLEIPGARIFSSQEALLRACRDYPTDSLCVIGGERVYRALLPYCGRVRLTRTVTPDAAAADRFFPNLDELPGWHAEAAEPPCTEGPLTYQFIDYVNSDPAPLPEGEG